MLTKNKKASSDFNSAESNDIAIIMREVKQHGFYSAFCSDVILNAPNHDDVVQMIKALAVRAHLKVSFNAAENICLFEGDGNDLLLE